MASQLKLSWEDEGGGGGGGRRKRVLKALRSYVLARFIKTDVV